MKILTQYPTTQKFLFDGYDLPSNATKNYDNNHENDVEDVSTSLFQHKIITNDYSKSILYATIDHEQFKEQKQHHQQHYCDEEEKKKGYQSKSEGNQHFNRTLNIIMTSTTTYIGKSQLRNLLFLCFNGMLLKDAWNHVDE